MKNKIIYSLLLIVLYYTNIIGRTHDAFISFVISGVINIVFINILLKINPFQKIGIYALFLPFVLLTIAVIDGAAETLFMPGLIGYFGYIISTCFGCILFYSKKNNLFFVFIGIYFILIFNYNNFFNFYKYSYDEKVNIGINLPIINLEDQNGQKITLEKDKILVIDLWSNHCSGCIKAFPKFEKVKNYYEEDEEIDFISINIYETKKEISLSKKYLTNFTFKQYYSNNTLYKILNFNSIPNYMIIGKDGKIKYFGSLNSEFYETYNNIYKLIDNEKNHR